MGNRVWKGEPSAGGRAGTIMLGYRGVGSGGSMVRMDSILGYSPVSNLSQTFSISFSEDARAIVSKDEESFHGDGYRYVKVAADPEQVDGTILDGRDYSSGQLPQENIRIIKEADATLRLNLGTQLDALYDRPHKEITNEGGTLIIIHDADSSEWHSSNCLV